MFLQMCMRDKSNETFLFREWVTTYSTLMCLSWCVYLHQLCCTPVTHIEWPYLSLKLSFIGGKKKSHDRIYICWLSTANYSPYFHLAISVTRDFSFNVLLNDSLFLVELLVWDNAARQTHISSVRPPCFDPNVNIEGNRENGAVCTVAALFSHQHDFICLGNICKENSPHGREGCETEYGLGFF